MSTNEKKKIIPIRVSESLYKKFKIKLIERDEKAQTVLEKAIREYVQQKDTN